MNHAEASRWLYRIYGMLRDTDVDVRITRKLNKCFGMVTVDADNIKMFLHPDRPWLKKGGFVSTIIHECLHLVDMDLPETEVQRLEREIFCALSDRQLGNLLKRIVWCIRKG